MLTPENIDQLKTILAFGGMTKTKMRIIAGCAVASIVGIGGGFCSLHFSGHCGQCYQAFGMRLDCTTLYPTLSAAQLLGGVCSVGVAAHFFGSHFDRNTLICDNQRVQLAP